MLISFDMNVCIERYDMTNEAVYITLRHCLHNIY